MGNTQAGLEKLSPNSPAYVPSDEEVAEHREAFEQFMNRNLTRQVTGDFFIDLTRPGPPYKWVEVWTIDHHHCRLGVRENEAGANGWRWAEQIKRPSEVWK